MEKFAIRGEYPTNGDAQQALEGETLKGLCHVATECIMEPLMDTETAQQYPHLIEVVHYVT